MRIGLIGDIHGNLPALDAVLAHARLQELDEYWNLGDFVGYGAFPDEVVDRVQQLGARSILGNYDQKVLQFPKKKKGWRKTKQPLKYEAFRRAHGMLTTQNRRYLKKLPAELRLSIENQTILLTHGSPASNEEPLTDRTPADRLRALALLAEADLICCGHSHVPFQHQVGGALFVNPGSIGRQADGDPRASYAVLSLMKKRVDVHLYRVAYDVELAARAIRERDLPEAFAQMVLQGLPLEEIVSDE